MTVTDQEILPGLRLYIHQDAIHEGAVKFVDDLGIDVHIQSAPNKEGWHLVSQDVVGRLTSAIRSLEITTYVGGGHYKVKGDPDKKQFPFSAHVKLDRQRAEKEAREHAMVVFSSKGDDKEDSKQDSKQDSKSNVTSNTTQNNTTTKEGK